MRLIVFTSSTTRSGGSRQALYQARGFAERGHEVLFFTPDTSTLRGLDPEAPFWRNLGPAANWRGVMEEAIFAGRKKAEQPTVVHAFHNAAVKRLAWWGLSWRRRGVLCVAHRGVVFRPRNPLTYWSPGIDCFIVNSLACADVLRSLFLGKKRLRVVYNAVPPERVLPTRDAADMRRDLGLPENAFVFGTVGGDNPVKGVEPLVRAFRAADIPGSRLLVLGVTPDKWTPLARELDIPGRAVFVDRTNNVGDYLQLLSAFVLPSLSESMPNTLLEALAAKLPAICSEVGGVSEIMGKSGLLVPPGDVHALASAMKRMRFHDEARDAMRAAAVKQAALFAPAHRLDALEGIYREFLAARGLVE